VEPEIANEVQRRLGEACRLLGEVSELGGRTMLTYSLFDDVHVVLSVVIVGEGVNPHTLANFHYDEPSLEKIICALRDTLNHMRASRENGGQA
jgi:hypothetical protein